MTPEQEITKLKKQVYELEQHIAHILPLGKELEERVKALESSLPPAPSPCVQPTPP